VEPDGLPNERNTPTSTLGSNIWYHLGLAYYLKGEWAEAERCYRKCLEFSRNPDMFCATTHWLYMTLRRSGRDDEARAVLEPITADMDIIENRAYHRLLLMYKGEVEPESLLGPAIEAGGADLATTGYGIGNWHVCHGDRKTAEQIFRRIVRTGFWPAFGHLAAEADLARIMDRAL
jgi:tetratricopeptide (TPR) repeat protein